MKIPKPINETQRRYNALCDLGGGQGGGPARTRVQELLHESGELLNDMGHEEIFENLAALSDRNPWHVCFAMGLTWGHLARGGAPFMEAAVNLLEDWNQDDLDVARSYGNERGPDPIEQSLMGGHLLFSRVRLPDQLPETLSQYVRAQNRWLGGVISPDRPRYIGSWNSTAMFMVALFSNLPLVAQMQNTEVMLPPGGPVFRALTTLHRGHLLNSPPSGNELDDEAYEPGSIYVNNDLFRELHVGHEGWSVLDVHSGLYMLGTNFAASNNWF